MIHNKKGLKISSVFHKTVFEMNEKGSEAAAPKLYVITHLSIIYIYLSGFARVRTTYIANWHFNLILCDKNSTLFYFFAILMANYLK